MGVTIPDLPAADFNKELRLALVANNGPIVWSAVEIVDLDALARIQDPVILMQGLDGRTCKARLGSLVEYLEKTVKGTAGKDSENLEDALFYLEGALPYLPEGIMKRNVKRLLESTKHEQAT
jgi:hypothetical protein